MFKKSYNGENMPQLMQELKSLQLPEFKGIAKLEREIDEQGRCVLVDKNGEEVLRHDDGTLIDSSNKQIPVQDTKAKKVAPYILIKGVNLSPSQITLIMDKIAAHVPKIPAKSEELEKANR
tara:strand:+ start:4702 stop:5064 length:363 start_codon:yes stop_codon:yes gene_type:complete